MMELKITDIMLLVERDLLGNFNQAFAWFEKDEQLRRYQPVNGGWTIDEVLEHVSLTNHFLLLIINKATNKAVKRAAKATEYKVPNDYADSLHRVDEVGKHKSFTWIRPDHMEPKGEAPDLVLGKLQEQLRNCLSCLTQLRNGEGFLVTTTMTVNGLGKIDVYRYLYFLSKHIERHITQMQLIENEYNAAEGRLN